MADHYIDEFRIELEAPATAQTDDWRRQLQFWCHTQEFTRLLESAIDLIVPEDENWEIEELTFSIEAENFSELQACFAGQFQRALLQARAAATQGINHPAKLNIQGEKTNQLEQLLFYLRTGQFRYSIPAAKIKSTIELLQQPVADWPTNQRKQIIDTGRRRPWVWQRLYTYLGLTQTAQLVSFQFGYTSQQLEALIEVLLSTDGRLKAISRVATPSQTDFTNGHLNGQKLTTAPVSSGNYPRPLDDRRLPPPIFQLLEQVSFGKDPLKMVPAEYQVKRDTSTKSVKQQPSTREQLEPNTQFSEGVAAGYAGLILLWGGLGTLFRRLGYVEGRLFIDTSYQERAIHLLHFAATGTTNDLQENQLVLAKLLCGWPIYRVINPIGELDEQEQLAVDDLLQHYLTSWLPQRRFSPKWLRESFLQRSGKLTIQGRQAKLSVDRAAQDVLLDAHPPPWGIGLARLAWMEGMLITEW